LTSGQDAFFLKLPMLSMLLMLLSVPHSPSRFTFDMTLCRTARHDASVDVHKLIRCQGMQESRVIRDCERKCL
jgi:hypothetical protein